MPFPGLNIDNAPLFAAIGAHATGTTMIHDWVYENRAIYLTELRRLGADVTLLDPHRLQVTGPTRWRPAEVGCPPALRPAVVLLLAMLAAPGTSHLRNVYVINRGHDSLAQRPRRPRRRHRDVPGHLKPRAQSAVAAAVGACRRRRPRVDLDMGQAPPGRHPGAAARRSRPPGRRARSTRSSRRVTVGVLDVRGPRSGSWSAGSAVGRAGRARSKVTSSPSTAPAPRPSANDVARIG